MSEVTGGNSSPPSPAETAPDDVLAEILLRLPPHPSFLSRASLVCKRWRRLTSNPGFLRRLRAFHRTPPVLGFFHNSPDLPRFVPAAEGPPGRIDAEASALRRDGDDGMWWFVDCRHGRALLRSRDWADLLVWDPITGERRRITVPDQMQEGASDRNAAVFCRTASGGDEDCHSSPFHVAVVFTSHGCLFACVYSSRIGSWGDLISTPAPSPCELYEEPPALVSEALYWLVNGSCILEFQYGRQSLTLIEQPLEMHPNHKRNIGLVRLEDDVLGVAFIKDFSLHLWAREVAADDCASKCILRRAIELDKLLPVPMMTLGNRYRVMPVWISGFSEDGNVVFIRTNAGIFLVWLETLKLKKVLHTVSSNICSFENQGR